MNAFFNDSAVQFATENALGGSYYQATDVGEVLAAIARIPNGDAKAWVTAWSATADRLAGLTREAEAAGHTRSATARGRPARGAHPRLARPARADMNTLSVWTFGRIDGAASALRVIERLQTRRRLSIQDAAVVSWPPGRHRPYSYQAGTIDGTAALSGAFWGLLFSELFLMPLADPEGAATRSAGLARTGLPDDRLRQLRRTVTAGTSALFLLAHKTALDTIGEDAGFGESELLVNVLKAEHQQVLRHVFGADDASPDWRD